MSKKDSLELSNGLKVSIAVDKKNITIGWAPKPPYDEETLDAIKEHVDPWLVNTINAR